MSERARQLLFLSRTRVAALVMLALVAALAFHLFTLQVTEHGYYRTLSDENRLSLIPSPPPRGLIYDRSGLLLADNRTVYSLEITPSLVADMDALLRQVRAVVEVGDDDLRRFRKTLRAGGFTRSIELRTRLSEEEVARFAVLRHHLRGADVVGRLVRHYPYDELFAHAIGYVGAISRDDLAALDQRRYRGTRHVGKTGIENHYERELHGLPGFRRVEVNAGGHLIRTIGGSKPRPGSDVMLTIDTALQEQAYSALGDYDGAVVALDPRSGDVLTLVSKPSFDPNLFSGSFSRERYRHLLNSPDKPFFNRAVSGQYPPGSIIKPMVALAALHNRVGDMQRKIFAGPYYQLPGYSRRYHDWREEGHGWINMNTAIVQSCDVFFYDTAHRLGINRLALFLEDFGLGSPTGVDTTAELAGIVPSPQWKREALGQAWFPAETIIAGIGQGYMLATPLQMAAMAAVLANRGERVVPRLVKAVRQSDTGLWRPLPVAERKRVIASPPEHWDYVIDAMNSVIHSPNGTAYRISRGMDYIAAGKTGTVQVTEIKEDVRYGIAEKEKLEPGSALEDHAMFIAFAPVENPEIAVAVVVEHGGSGARTAAPIARRLLDVYFGLLRAQFSLHASG